MNQSSLVWSSYLGPDLVDRPAAVVTAAVAGDRAPGGPEAARTQHLVPAEGQVATPELVGVGFQHAAGGFGPEVHAFGAQVHGPEVIGIAQGQAHAADLPRHLFGLQPGALGVGHAILAQAHAGAEQSRRDDRDAQLLDDPQLPEVGGEVRPQVAEGHGTGLVRDAELFHLLEQTVALGERGGVRVEALLDVGAVVEQQPSEGVQHRSGHCAGRDRLHLPEGGDGDRLFHAELAVLAAPLTDAREGAVDLQRDGRGIVPVHEGATHLLRHPPERAQGDVPEERRLEPDHPAGERPFHFGRVKSRFLCYD